MGTLFGSGLADTYAAYMACFGTKNCPEDSMVFVKRMITVPG